MIKKTLFLIMVIGVLLLAGCSLGGVTSGSVVQGNQNNDDYKSRNQGTAYQVSIKDNSFRPNDLEISVGDTVEWVNLGEYDHTLTMDNGKFDAHLSNGGTANYKFTEPGIYTYHSQCTDSHEETCTTIISGTVLVR